MSVRSLFDTPCILAFAIGINVIFLAYWAVGSFSRWLGAKSRIKQRTAKEEGVPVWITGNFERKVISDPDAKYFGAVLDKDGLAPRGKFIAGPTRFADWARA